MDTTKEEIGVWAVSDFVAVVAMLMCVMCNYSDTFYLRERERGREVSRGAMGIYSNALFRMNVKKE